jgi:hypothetical protein
LLSDLFFESLTVKVRLKEPVAVGVPESTPLLLKESPAGDLLIHHEYGAVPPLAAKVAENGVETDAAGNFAVLIESAVAALAIDATINRQHIIMILLTLYFIQPPNSKVCTI